VPRVKRFKLEEGIAFFCEALKKTQANLKSKELEEMMHGAVTGEVWRKKQERRADPVLLVVLQSHQSPRALDSESKYYFLIIF
jgi:hypothetical protein